MRRRLPHAINPTTQHYLNNPGLRDQEIKTLFSKEANLSPEAKAAYEIMKNWGMTRGSLSAPDIAEEIAKAVLESAAIKNKPEPSVV